MKTKIVVLINLILFGIITTTYADIPIVSHHYLADPAAMVHDGRVYIYCSNDDQNPLTEDAGYQMTSIVCVSSSDLKNWTDHGIVFSVPQGASWAGRSWAPSVVERNGNFYLYFGDGGSSIGVAVSDSPIGPFTDPVGGSLVNGNTPGVLPADNIWIFDPMTFIDDDGQAYMYFGGNGYGNMRIVKLNEDMISLDGSAIAIDSVPFFFEAAWMHKYNDTYYFSYSTNPDNGMRIDYLTSDNPTGNFTYGGILAPQPPDNNNNNHQAVFEFEGTWYVAYHNRYVATQAGIPPVYHRNICLDSIFHNPDGSITQMVNTMDGLPQVGYLDPYVHEEAETMDDQSGIKTDSIGLGEMAVNQLENGDWIKVRGVDFGSTGAAAFTAGVSCDLNYGSTVNASIEVRTDSLDGTLIGTVPVSYTGGADVWKEETIAVEETTGVHDLYFVFTSEYDGSLFNFDYWQFTEKTASHDLLAINAAVDDYKLDTIPGSDSTKFSVNAIYSDGTSEDITLLASYTFNPDTIVSLTDSIIVGIDYGTVTITADYNSSSDSIKIIVKDIISELTVAQLNATPESFELFTGGSAQVLLEAVYEDGHVEDVTSIATYSNPNPEIATISEGVISGVSVGEVDITASYQGEFGEAKDTVIHVSVVEAGGVWLEAECGTVGSLWDVKTSSTASSTEYVEIKSGNNSNNAAPTNESGWISYTFDIPATAVYTVYFRVICPNAEDDSFWLKMDDGSFAMWNGIEGGSAWNWTNFPTTYELEAGSHTLTVGYREDGAKLDKIWITNSGADIEGLGEEASNLCKEPELIQENDFEVNLYPNPATHELTVSMSASPADISIYTSDGKQVYKQQTNLSDVTISLSNYYPGVYMVKVTSQNSTIIRKIIKE